MNMKRIMFNDRFGLTDAVLEGKKTVTRRMVCKPNYDEVFDNSVDRFNKGWIDHIELMGGGRAYAYKAPYKVGEVVAVAQSYAIIAKDHHDVDYFLAQVGKSLGIDDFDGAGWFGWKNKQFVKADLMPHRIRITRVRAEQLRDITDEDCLREGIESIDVYEKVWSEKPCTMYRNPVYKRMLDDNPREGFAALIDEISGKGTWNANPWVWRIEFELIK